MTKWPITHFLNETWLQFVESNVMGEMYYWWGVTSDEDELSEC